MRHPARSALRSRHTLALVAGLMLGAAVLAPLAALADGYQNRTQKIRVLPTLDVEIWTDKGRGAKYCVGEEIEIFFRTNADAYVAVFDLDTRGEIHRLFPNRYDREQFVRGSRTYRLPANGYRFEVEGPAGRETLKIVAAESRRELRRAVDELIFDRGHYPASDWSRDDRDRDRRYTKDEWIPARERISVHEKIVTVPDGVAYASIDHRVRDGRACRTYDRPGYRPWWR
ncbi:MAG: DUF4384 domain-containing protein [Acidobacteriota bacterium]